MHMWRPEENLYIETVLYFHIHVALGSHSSVRPGSKCLCFQSYHTNFCIVLKLFLPYIEETHVYTAPSSYVDKTLFKDRAHLLLTKMSAVPSQQPLVHGRQSIASCAIPDCHRSEILDIC